MSIQASGLVPKAEPKAEPKSWSQTLRDIWVIVSALPMLPSAACLCLTFGRDFLAAGPAQGHLFAVLGSRHLGCADIHCSRHTL